jgi:transcriptional regulator with XRE-family HTH domain
MHVRRGEHDICLGYQSGAIWKHSDFIKHRIDVEPKAQRAAPKAKQLPTSSAKTIVPTYKVPTTDPSLFGVEPLSALDIGVNWNLESLRSLPTHKRVTELLATKGLTLHAAAERSRILYGQASQYWLPHNLYHDLKNAAFSPSLEQFCALSRISGYRLSDWLRLFGFAPEAILKMQLASVPRRTKVLETPEMPRPVDIRTVRMFVAHLDREIVPFSQLPSFSPIRSFGQDWRHESRFLYVRVGLEDTLAFPDLLPGSVVRVALGEGNSALQQVEQNGNTIFLLEHGHGFWCCRLQPGPDQQVIVVSDQLPGNQLRFLMPKEAQVRGIVDLEIRATHTFTDSGTPAALSRLHTPISVTWNSRNLGSLLRMRRLQAGLSLREASAISNTLAASFGDDRFFASPGTLSDYETREDAPRHMHKIITLCSVYGIRLLEFIAAMGAHIEELGRQAIPSQRIQTFAGVMPTPFSELNTFFELAAVPLTGMKGVSIRDCFWNRRGIDQRSLRDALFFIVNRRKKHRNASGFGRWRQELILFWEREGSYHIGTPLAKGGLLGVDEGSGHGEVWAEKEFEVVGQIVTVIREIR